MVVAPNEWRDAAASATLVAKASPSLLSNAELTTMALPYLWPGRLSPRPTFPRVAVKLGAPVFSQASPILGVLEKNHYRLGPSLSLALILTLKPLYTLAVVRVERVKTLHCVMTVLMCEKNRCNRLDKISAASQARLRMSYISCAFESPLPKRTESTWRKGCTWA